MRSSRGRKQLLRRHRAHGPNVRSCCLWLKPFEVISVMRERTPLPRSIIEQLLYYDAEAIRIIYDGKTAYDVLLDYTGEARDHRTAVVEMFKFHCIGHSSMTRHEKETYLYPKNQEGRP